MGFNERWGIEIDTEAEFRKLKARITVVVGDDRLDVTKDEARMLAFRLGVPVSKVASSGSFGGSYWYISNGSLLDSSRTVKEFAKNLECLMNSVTAFNEVGRNISKLVNDSHCGLRILKKDGSWITYPEGETLIDEEVVERTLSFLSGNPADEYRKAINHYASQNWEEAAEKTRRTIEEYLRQKNGTKQGLSASIKTLGGSLKQNGDVPDHLKTTLQKMLLNLDSHYNDSSKHNSVTYGEIEVEYLIYQVGVILVLIEKLNIKKVQL